MKFGFQRPSYLKFGGSLNWGSPKHPKTMGFHTKVD